MKQFGQQSLRQQFECKFIWAAISKRTAEGLEKWDGVGVGQEWSQYKVC